ncbi:MAG: outer membrane lipoprotein-sorting protein [Deltaproteobacteria bacterium]|nr:outer membrane lipoprotein-sorting protein [Deltaproteobacteria bacterium]
MMKASRSSLTTAIAVLSLLAVPILLGLDASAKDDKSPGSLTALEILKKSDDLHFGYQDSQLKIKTIVKDKDGKKSELKYNVWEKGEKRLIVMDEPPDVAGMAVLSKDEDTIYVYEPEFNKVRRIASHAKKQTMFGMDYTSDETATKHLHKSYTPKIKSETSEKAVLTLEQKSGKDKAWPKLEVTIEKNNHWAATKILFMDKNGKKKKPEVRPKIKQLGGRYLATVMTMTDHGKKHSTTLLVKSAKYDKGLSDKMFTKRYLIREE